MKSWIALFLGIGSLVMGLWVALSLSDDDKMEWYIAQLSEQTNPNLDRALEYFVAHPLADPAEVKKVRDLEGQARHRWATDVVLRYIVQKRLYEDWNFTRRMIQMK